MLMVNIFVREIFGFRLNMGVNMGNIWVLR